MKSFVLLIFFGGVFARPQTPLDTKGGQEYPPNANIQVVSNNGPGCPIQSSDRRVSVVDYMWGFVWENDEKTDSVWGRALNLPFTITPANWNEEAPDSRWCEHTWKFTKSAGYRLTVNKNGTEIIARYRMKEGTKANWKITYYHPDGTESGEEIVVNGPLGGPYSSSSFSLANETAKAPPPAKPFKTGCREEDHVIKMKTEARLEGSSWGQVWGGNENDYYNRVMQTFTYAWEKCE